MEKIVKENKALRQLLEWAIECDFGFDQFASDMPQEEWNEFQKETAGMSYLDSMIYYAERWLENNE